LICCEKDKTPKFDEKKAFQYLMEQCQFGPRNPGSQGHQKARDYLLDILEQYAKFVRSQDFFYFDSLRGEKLELTNIIASFYPELKRRVILCAHWDTRPFADKDPDPESRSEPILGANDGASGVALLLEIASLLAVEKPKWGVDIVFFDGEDYGPEGRYDMYLLGSQFFSKNFGDYRPEFGILVDLIGDEDLEIYREGYSDRYAKNIVDLIWNKARELNCESFCDSVKHWVLDDHLPLIGAGIPCADIIDLDYPYWHTLADTPDKCSPQSLKEVGEVILKILYE
jgi:hypothetical protein